VTNFDPKKPVRPEKPVEVFYNKTCIFQALEQKRLVRCLAGVRYWPGQEPLCSCRPLFARLNLLPVFSIYLLECCKFARRFPHYFQRTEEVHSHNTRNKAELYVGASTLQISRMNPAVCVPTLYNALPAEIRVIRGYKRYVSALKKFVYENKFYSQDEFLMFE